MIGYFLVPGGHPLPWTLGIRWTKRGPRSTLVGWSPA